MLSAPAALIGGVASCMAWPSLLEPTAAAVGKGEAEALACRQSRRGADADAAGGSLEAAESRADEGEAGAGETRGLQRAKFK